MAGLILASAAFTASASAEPLSAWNDTPTKKAIENWVSASTTKGSPAYIPEERRYAVFDNDGTLWPEAPLTFQIQFIVDEIKRLAPEHPEWQKDPDIKAVLDGNIKSLAQENEKALLKMLDLTSSGMTADEYQTRVSAWFAAHKDARFGCHYDQMAYQPMKQLLDYLREKGFKTWIVSGGGIDFMRVVSQKMYGIPPEQVIGSYTLSGFTVTDNQSQLNKTMDGVFNNDGKNKPVAIHIFMGHQPVGAFGNSDGDMEMLQYAHSNQRDKGFSLLVHHTDADREYAYDAHPPASGTLVRGLEQAKQQGWTVVDTRQDWKTIFDPALCPAPQTSR
ncbi:haloacid dehalogenase-like hydrolase [Salmonella enterica]|nr:haloacid dehalogenase-like hydrolase [Salmonella enterica]